MTEKHNRRERRASRDEDAASRRRPDRAPQPQKKKPIAATPDRGPVTAVVMVAVVAFIAATLGIVNQLTRDDLPIVVGDPRIHDLGHVFEILTLPYWPPPAHPDLYRPLASLLLALQYVIGGGSPVVFRFVSIALYVAASLAVLRLARRVLAPGVALGIALLFAAHPVHVEAVAQAVNQGELIVGAIACVMTTTFLDHRRAGIRSTDWLMLGGLYFAATLVKETAFVLPMLVLAADLILPRGDDFARPKGWWTGYVILVAPGVLAFALRTAVVGSASGSFVADALVNLGVGGRALTMLGVVPEWLRLVAWPAHLRVDYSPGEFVAATSLGASQAFGLAILLAAAAMAWFARHRAPAITFGLVWCAIALLPVSNVLLPTGILIAERTLFLPSVGFLIAAGGAIQLVMSRLTGSRVVVTRVIPAACGLLVFAGVMRSASRQRDWYDTPSLRIANLRDSPRSWRAQSAYGETLFEEGRAAAGLAAYHEAIRWTPTPWQLRNELSDRLRNTGNDSAALTELRISLAEQPGQREASAKFIAALLAVGRYDEARHVADSIIVVAGAPRLIVGLRRVADSAIVLRAPVGSVKVRVGR